MYADCGTLVEELETLIQGAGNRSAENTYEEGLRDGTIWGLIQAQDLILGKLKGRADSPARNGVSR
jgi:hypothetical protein